jgi:hypothetical protein
MLAMAIMPKAINVLAFFTRRAYHVPGHYGVALCVITFAVMPHTHEVVASLTAFAEPHTPPIPLSQTVRQAL